MLTATATRTIWVAQFRSHERAIVFRLPGVEGSISKSCHEGATARERAGEHRSTRWADLAGTSRPSRSCRYAAPAMMRAARDDPTPRRAGTSRGGSCVRGRPPGRARRRGRRRRRPRRRRPPPTPRGCTRPSRGRALGDLVRRGLRPGAAVPRSGGRDQRGDRGVRAARRDRPAPAPAPDARRADRGGGRSGHPRMRVRFGADRGTAGRTGRAGRRRPRVPPVGPGDQPRRDGRDGRGVPRPARRWSWPGSSPACSPRSPSG